MEIVGLLHSYRHLQLTGPFSLSCLFPACVCSVVRHFALPFTSAGTPFFIGLFWFFSPLLNDRLPLHVYLLCFPYVYSFMSLDALEYV